MLDSNHIWARFADLNLNCCLLQVYALLDRVKAERQDHDVADLSRDQDSMVTAAEPGNTNGEEPHARYIDDSDDEGSVATLQLHASDDGSLSEKTLSVRKLRLPGASQRTSQLKLRKRSGQ